METKGGMSEECLLLFLRVGVCMRDCAEGPEIRILGKRDCAEGLEFGGAKRRRKFLGFMCTDAWERVHICEA